MGRIMLLTALVGCALLLGACSKDEQDLVLYTSVDRPVSEPIVREFQRRTGIRVLLVTDTEATKSIGLAERLAAERDNPQADVWWGNEVFHTVNLAEAGVLEGYDSPAAGGIPNQFKDSEQRWAGTGLRARVIAFHPASGPSRPMRLEDLTAPAYQGKLAMASPGAGTTGGHVAALYVLWGEEKARSFFSRLHANDIRLLGGNGPVADGVGQGAFAAGLTDNDDVAAVNRRGGAAESIVPDQEPGGIGTLTIPTTVALVKGARHEEAARALVDYLLSAEVEQMLLEAQFAAYSVRASEGARAIRSMDVDYSRVAKALPGAVRDAEAILRGRAATVD